MPRRLTAAEERRLFPPRRPTKVGLEARPTWRVRRARCGPAAILHHTTLRTILANHMRPNRPERRFFDLFCGRYPHWRIYPQVQFQPGIIVDFVAALPCGEIVNPNRAMIVELDNVRTHNASHDKERDEWAWQRYKINTWRNLAIDVLDRPKVVLADMDAFMGELDRLPMVDVRTLTRIESCPVVWPLRTAATAADDDEDYEARAEARRQAAYDRRVRWHRERRKAQEREAQEREAGHVCGPPARPGQRPARAARPAARPRGPRTPPDHTEKHKPPPTHSHADPMHVRIDVVQTAPSAAALAGRANLRRMSAGRPQSDR